MILKLSVIGFLVILLNQSVKCANILDMMTCASPSHFVWHKALIYALAARGHNVTVISTDVEETKVKNVHYIHLEAAYDVMYNSPNPIDLLEMAEEGPIDGVFGYYGFGISSCDGSLQSEGLRHLLNYPRDFKWDLIMNDYTLGPCLGGIVHHFNNPPFIGVTAFNYPPFTSDLVGGHKYFTYVPFYCLNYDVFMSFFERIFNAFVYAFDHIYRHYIFMPRLDKLVRDSKLFADDMPYIGAFDEQTVLALVNAHPSVDFAEPVPPNVIPVGGLQIIEAKPLPNDIEAFFNASKKGAVLFSLGTNMRSDMLGEGRLKIIVETLKQFPDYHFLWKFESDSLPVAKPANVMIKPWVSQNDVLAHPRIKAFITHAGLLSTHEATWHGVPMLGIPIFVDQHRNLYKSIQAGVAERVYFQTITVKEFKEKLTKILNDPSYTKNIKIRSQRFRDQPEHPLDRAIWWIEYIIRNPNPDHLRVPTIELGYIAANHYDIILFFIILLGVPLFYICFKLMKPKNVVEIKKKKN